MKWGAMPTSGKCEKAEVYQHLKVKAYVIEISAKASFSKFSTQIYYEKKYKTWSFNQIC